MRKIFMAISLFIVLNAGILEVKDSSGKTIYLTEDKSRLYVCYDRRVIYAHEDTQMLKYIGCNLYINSCKSNHKARFGKYPSTKKARNALIRCKKSKPKFID